eukprot:scaffold316_cov124-Isochrysis_galbana.AAC.2
MRKSTSSCHTCSLPQTHSPLRQQVHDTLCTPLKNVTHCDAGGCWHGTYMAVRTHPPNKGARMRVRSCRCNAPPQRSHQTFHASAYTRLSRPCAPAGCVPVVPVQFPQATLTLPVHCASAREEAGEAARRVRRRADPDARAVVSGGGPCWQRHGMFPDPAQHGSHNLVAHGGSQLARPQRAGRAVQLAVQPSRPAGAQVEHAPALLGSGLAGGETVPRRPSGGGGARGARGPRHPASGSWSAVAPPGWPAGRPTRAAGCGAVVATGRLPRADVKKAAAPRRTKPQPRRPVGLQASRAAGRTRCGVNGRRPTVSRASQAARPARRRKPEPAPRRRRLKRGKPASPTAGRRQARGRHRRWAGRRRRAGAHKRGRWQLLRSYPRPAVHRRRPDSARELIPPPRRPRSIQR